MAQLSLINRFKFISISSNPSCKPFNNKSPPSSPSGSTTTSPTANSNPKPPSTPSSRKSINYSKHTVPLYSTFRRRHQKIKSPPLLPQRQSPRLPPLLRKNRIIIPQQIRIPSPIPDQTQPRQRRLLELSRTRPLQTKRLRRLPKSRIHGPRKRTPLSIKERQKQTQPQVPVRPVTQPRLQLHCNNGLTQ